MKKLAIPVSSGQLAAHFGHAQSFYFYEIEDNTVIKQSMETPPVHAPGTIPKWVAEMKATNIIVGGIGGMAVDIFVKNGVEVHAGITSGNPVDLVNKFINGELTQAPDACEHHDHDHEHGEGHEHHHH